MIRYCVAAVLLVFWGSGISHAWEMRSEIPDTIGAGESFVLDVWEWLAAGDCYVCTGYTLEYGDHSAEVVLGIERVKPWGDPCNGPGDICDYGIEVAFDDPGSSTLSIIERVIAPPFGGDTLIGAIAIEVEEPVFADSATWGALKAIYR